MINRVLVANRGEIAVRVIRAAHEIGAEAVALVASGDPRAPHARWADDIVVVDAPTPRLVYLNGEAVVDAARRTSCDAVHPGYGFLSEDGGFARQCAAEGLIFVGPSPEAIELSGDKVEAKSSMRAAGVPVVPGSDGAVEDPATAVRVADEIGYPLLCKAAAGGGGKGIRIVRSPSEMEETFSRATEEARVSFGSGALYLERYLAHVRHIEVQVIADHHGTAVHLGERECSIQRRHQKMLEEAPAPSLSDDQREELTGAALAAVKATGYTNAGTVEFVLDVDTGRAYFIEMNARIQVEHPVTEAVTGLDLVREQFGVSDGRPLSFGQTDVAARGHAIECRLTAEDPRRGFVPSPGTISRYRIPGGPGVRVDGYLEAGDEVTPFYDSLIAKLVVHGSDRPSALARLRRALAECEIEGVATTVEFHRLLADHPAFVAGLVTTGFLRE